MPEHFGERRLAESFAEMDDGKLHLWFDLALPGVLNLDVVLWDENVGVFVLETKAIPIEALRHFDDTAIEIADRGWSQSPVSQARSALYSLKDYLRSSGVQTPKMASTAVWPRITRDEWLSHWDANSFPKEYDLSMVFADDIAGGIVRFRERLRWIAEHPVWGAMATSGFQHNKVVFQAFANALRPVARVAPRPRAAEPPSEEEQDADVSVASEDECGGGLPVPVRGVSRENSYRAKLWLGTEYVESAAVSARAVLGGAAPLLGKEWALQYDERIGEIVERLQQPFRLGVIGEFRAGKSSLVNALVGQEVALVEEMECTFAPQRFYYAEAPEASLVRRDGTVERVSVDALVAMFRDAYASGKLMDIAHTEVGLPAPMLQAIDIWDSPGLGGSDENAQTARQFADTVDAALWVFDAAYSGQRGLSPTIQSLEQHGKTLVGVVNKCEFMTLDEVQRVEEVLRRAYPPLRTAECVAFSATLALYPDNDRAADLDWAVDASGNLQRLLDVIREVILTSPGRLTGRAAAGDLRAVVGAMRDDIGAAALDVKRRQYLYRSELGKAEQLLQRELNSIGRELENGCVLALMEHLNEAGAQVIAGLSDETLRDRKRTAESLRGKLTGGLLAGFLEAYLQEQQAGIKQRLQNILALSDTSLSNALTPLERYDDRMHLAARRDAEPAKALEDEPQAENASLSGVLEGFDAEAFINVGGGTLAALGTIALLVPGPQWMVVIPAALLSGFLAGWRRRGPLQDLRALAMNDWHGAVNEYFKKPELRARLGEAIAEWCARLHGALLADVRSLLKRKVYDGAEESELARRLDQLSALSTQTELIIEQLGNPLFALPPVDDMLSRKATIPAGERERTQELLRRVLGLATDVAAITDGAFSILAMPLLLEVPADATIRILTWEQPLSEVSPTFRSELEDLRRRRTGSLAVATPVSIEESQESLPSGSWVFLPGRAFHFNLPLYEVWMASGPVSFEPYDDAGGLYHQNFGRWWNGEVTGYQTVHLRRNRRAEGI
jgi:hypothetical protein